MSGGHRIGTLSESLRERKSLSIPGGHSRHLYDDGVTQVRRKHTGILLIWLSIAILTGVLAFTLGILLAILMN